MLIIKSALCICFIIMFVYLVFKFFLEPSSKYDDDLKYNETFDSSNIIVNSEEQNNKELYVRSPFRGFDEDSKNISNYFKQIDTEAFKKENKLNKKEVQPSEENNQPGYDESYNEWEESLKTDEFIVDFVKSCDNQSHQSELNSWEPKNTNAMRESTPLHIKNDSSEW